MPDGPSIDVDVFGESVLRLRLLRWAHEVLDMDTTYRRIARRLNAAAAQQFESEGAFGGAPWERLADSTVRRKARSRNPVVRANATRILQATGALRDSLVNDADPEHIEDITADGLRWGSRVDYGVFHQSRRPRSKLPRRPVVALPPWLRREIVRDLQEGALGSRGRTRLR